MFNSKKFFNLSNSPLGIIGKDLNLLEANPSLIRLCNLENRKLFEVHLTTLFFKDDLEIVNTQLNKILTGTPSVSFESRLVRPNQDTKWFSWEIIADENSHNYYLSGSDITEHRIPKSALEEYTDKLLKIIDLVPHPIFLKNSDAQYILVNQAQADLFSASKNDFIGKDDSFFIKNKEELKGVHASDRVILEKKKNVLLPEQIITHPNGEYKILHTSKIPFLSSFNGEVNILGVSIDITEIKNSEKELRKINFELDSFVYHASHDLRAPLCSLEGLFNLINTEQEDEFRKKCVNEGLKSIKKLDGFISDLTDLSRSNRMAIEPEAIPFPELIKDTLDALQFMNDADKINISIDSKGQELIFYSDLQRIKVIFMNLISNAIKYQRKDIPNPSLAISINVTKGFSEIEFKDNGIGIEEKYRPKVFDMFFRGTVSSNGSGLGLYITKEVILKLGGAIELFSEENKGTTISMKIPNLQKEIQPTKENRIGKK